MPKCPQCGIERETLVRPCLICGLSADTSPNQPLAVSPKRERPLCQTIVMRSRAADKLAASPKRECPICGKEIHTDAASCHHCEEHPGDLANPPKVTNGETSDISSGDGDTKIGNRQESRGLQKEIADKTPQKEGDNKMSLGCQRILIAYIIVMALMLLFPPMLDVPRDNDWKIVSAGFYFIGSIGRGGGYTCTLGVHLQQLSLQVAMVSLMAATGYLILKDRRN